MRLRTRYTDDNTQHHIISYKWRKLAGNSGNVEWIELPMMLLFSRQRIEFKFGNRKIDVHRCERAERVEVRCKRASQTLAAQRAIRQPTKAQLYTANHINNQRTEMREDQRGCKSDSRVCNHKRWLV
jgi:hypothetical protein